MPVACKWAIIRMYDIQEVTSDEIVMGVANSLNQFGVHESELPILNDADSHTGVFDDSTVPFLRRGQGTQYPPTFCDVTNDSHDRRSAPVFNQSR